LTLILGALRRGLAGATGEVRETLAAGQRNAERLLGQINELLDLAKLDSGRLALRKVSVDLAALVRGVAANFESSTRRRVHLRGLAEVVPIEADPGQLKKVFYNLLANAFKFSDPERGEVWLRLRAMGEQVEVEVEDNGIGIPREQLGRIFERFTHVEGSASRRYEGTGIGLALVQEIVTLHGGRIGVESVVEKGSTFTVTLPRGAATEATLVALEAEEAGGPSRTWAEPVGALPGAAAAVPTLAGGREGAAAADPTRPVILVADDNADLRAYVSGLLRPHYRVQVAKDGGEALRLAQASPPDVILTDVMMPQVSGYEVLTAVRGDTRLRGTPVIFLTARAGPEAQAESLEAGADDYLCKPFEERELLARVKNVLRMRQQERALAQLQQEKLKRFLPAPLASVLDSAQGEEVLKSHRREITVLFVDLRGFTAFAETAEPEDVMGVLRDYQGEIGRLMQHYGGTLERFTGDGLMLYFNDPVPMPHHAAQAVRLAVAIRGRIEELRVLWKKRGFELNAGMGIATGYATLGVVGFEGRIDYAGIGTVTNLAARLCGEAQAGQILLSGRSLALVEDLVQTEPIGDLVLKGFHRPVAAYNVLQLSEVQDDEIAKS
jgi:class 3 adenylate cyclase/anti-sigma regulatory factor (Ser/Thr protein kinase)